MRLQGLSAERPLTHDLLVSVLGALGSQHQPGRGHPRHRRDLPRAPLPRERRAATRPRSTRGRPTRSRSRCAPARRSTSTSGCWTRPASSPTPPRRASAEDEERLAVFREFVNSLDVDLPGPARGAGPAEEL